jgi:hypothetical protein
MSRGGRIQSEPLTEPGAGEGTLLQYQTEQKFAAKMLCVFLLVVSLIDVWTLFTWNKSCSILYVGSKKIKLICWPCYDLFSKVWFHIYFLQPKFRELYLLF